LILAEDTFDHAIYDISALCIQDDFKKSLDLDQGNERASPARKLRNKCSFNNSLLFNCRHITILLYFNNYLGCRCFKGRDCIVKTSTKQNQKDFTFLKCLVSSCQEVINMGCIIDEVNTEGQAITCNLCFSISSVINKQSTEKHDVLFREDINTSHSR
jgi:hypothetical protein